MDVTLKNYIETEFTHLLNSSCDADYAYFVGLLHMALFLKEITEAEYAYYRSKALGCM